MAPLVDGFHDALAVAVGGVKHDSAVTVGETVETVDRAVDERLGHVGYRRRGGEKAREIGVVLQFEGVQGPHPGIGFGNHRIAGAGGQLPCGRQAGDQSAFGHAHPGGAEAVFHARFVAHGGDVGRPQAEDVEIFPQAGLGGQPVFVEGVQTVDLAVTVGKPAAGAPQGIVIVQVRDAVIVAQRRLHRRRQRLPGNIGDAEHAGAELFQVAAEPVVLRRKMGGKIDNVHRGVLLEGPGGCSSAPAAGRVGPKHKHGALRPQPGAPRRRPAAAPGSADLAVGRGGAGHRPAQPPLQAAQKEAGGAG